MSRTSRVPGNFANSSVGRARRVVDYGWRQFMMNDSECTIEDPLSQITSIAETTGATVVTFEVEHAQANDHPIDACVAFKPLRDPSGVVITYGKPFTLRTVVELVSISGDYGTADDTNVPHITVGLCTHTTDMDAAENDFIGVGYQLQCIGSEDIANDGWGALTYKHQTNNNRVTDHANSPDTTSHPLCSAMFYVGPDLDAEYNAYVSWMYLQASGGGDPYDALYGNPQIKDLNVNQFTPTAGSPVMMWVAVGDKTASTDVNSTPTVVTFRVHYLVTAAPEGWGGGGAA